MITNTLRWTRGMLLTTISIWVIGCTNSPTGRSQLLLVSDEEMVQLGQTTFENLKKNSRIVKDVKTVSYVNCVTNALLAQLPSADANKWEVEVFEDATPNAFALPGRKIGVHTGMLAVAKNQDQLATVIGHEIGHVQSKHSAERMSMNTLTNIGQTIAATLLKGSESKNVVTGALGIGAEYGVLLPYSRKHESEADKIGLNLMAKAGFSPAESVNLWINMSQVNSQEVPEFLSTHPANSTRIKDLKAELNQAQTLYNQAVKDNVKPNCKL